MVAAPVGFQCPVCVGAAAEAGLVARTVAGGGRVSKPTVTYVLIGINVAVYLLQLLRGVEEVAGDWGMWPIGIGIYNEWWRLLTGAFLHGSFLHIAFNMYVLFALGPTLERVLGHGRYLLLYLVAALGGSVASYAFSDFQTVSVGASGAIFGLMGALVVAGRRLRYDIKQVVILLVINFVIGFIAPNVDWRAHLGGLLTGAAMAAVLVMAPRAHRMLWQTLGVVGILFVLGAIVIWRTAELIAMFAPDGGLAT